MRKTRCLLLNTGEIKFPHNLPWSYALELLKLLKFHGYRAYLVGGCVRDILWGLEPGDYDIATSARPQQMIPFLPEVDKIGLRYGVLRVKKGEFHYQIATFRQDDAQSDGRRPKRIFFSDLEGDAKRRDFTINAIYLDPLVPALIDPQNGIPDLETKILRIIGDPAIRLREDHLRILRAIRFASRFNLTIEQNSFSALKKSAFLVKKITPDRVREELTRTFCEGDVNYALELLHNSGILSILWEIFSQEKDTLYTAVRDDMRGNQEKNPVSVWKAFFQPWTRLKNGADLVERELIKLNFPKKWKKGIMKADK